MGLGFMIAFILILACCIWVCEKCGCCKSDEKPADGIPMETSDHHVIEYDHHNSGYPDHHPLHTEIDH